MATLYEITSNIKNLEMLAALGEVDEQCLNDTWESLDGEFEDKADAYAKVMRNFTSDAETLKKEVERLAARRKSLENTVNRMKEQLYDAMKTCGKQMSKTAIFSFNIAKNPAKVVVDDVDKVPDKYLIPQPAQIDKQAVKNFLASGQECDFAHLEQSESLRIR